MTNNTVKIELEINLEELKDSIEEATELNDNEAIFSNLVQFSRAKKQIAQALDQLTSIEEEAKSAIKSKAEALYGQNWQSIKGRNYKITRSYTGSVFNILPSAKPPKDLLIVKQSLDSKKVEAFIKETGKLPKGIEYNPSRGTTLRITVSDENS